MRPFFLSDSGGGAGSCWASGGCQTEKTGNGAYLPPVGWRVARAWLSRPLLAVRLCLRRGGEAGRCWGLARALLRFLWAFPLALVLLVAGLAVSPSCCPLAIFTRPCGRVVAPRGR